MRVLDERSKIPGVFLKVLEPGEAAEVARELRALLGQRDPLRLALGLRSSRAYQFYQSDLTCPSIFGRVVEAVREGGVERGARTIYDYEVDMVNFYTSVLSFSPGISFEAGVGVISGIRECFWMPPVHLIWS